MAVTLVRGFPVLLTLRDREQLKAHRSTWLSHVAWEALAPHEDQARRNHSQSLETLASRGGLGPDEMIAILEDRRWTAMPLLDAMTRLEQMVEVWNLAQEKDPRR